MFKTDPFNVFAAVDEDRKIVICRIAVWGGGPEDPGGRVWFIENARSIDWAFRFERLRAETGERKRHARLAQGRGDLPDDAACREIVADFIRSRRIVSTWNGVSRNAPLTSRSRSAGPSVEARSEKKPRSSRCRFTGFDALNRSAEAPRLAREPGRRRRLCVTPASRV